jgi:hypothetical protein
MYCEWGMSPGELWQTMVIYGDLWNSEAVQPGPGP